MKKTTLLSVLAALIVTSLLVLPSTVFAADGKNSKLPQQKVVEQSGGNSTTSVKPTPAPAPSVKPAVPPPPVTKSVPAPAPMPPPVVKSTPTPAPTPVPTKPITVPPPQPTQETSAVKNATNLYEYYSASGKPLPPLSERAEMYQAQGLGPASSYRGTAEQNTNLLNNFKQKGIAPSTGEELGYKPQTSQPGAKPAPTPVLQPPSPPVTNQLPVTKTPYVEPAPAPPSKPATIPTPQLTKPNSINTYAAPVQPVNPGSAPKPPANQTPVSPIPGTSAQIPSVQPGISTPAPSRSNTTQVTTTHSPTTPASKPIKPGTVSPSSGGGSNVVITNPANSSISTTAQPIINSTNQAQLNTSLTVRQEQGIAWGNWVSPEFLAKVVTISNELGVDPNHLMAAMAFETGGTFDPAEKNKWGSGATGLIQFMRETAQWLGTTTEELGSMSAVDQLDYVRKHLLPYKGRMNTIGDVYMAIFCPRGIGKTDDSPLYTYPEPGYVQNSKLDKNKDDTITKGEAVSPVGRYLNLGLLPQNIGSDIVTYPRKVEQVPSAKSTPTPPPSAKSNVPTPNAKSDTSSKYSALDAQSDAATIISSYTTPLIVIDYIKEAEKEGVTLRDMSKAWRDLPEIVKWAKNNPDEAFDGFVEGMTKAAAVGVNGLLEASQIAPLTRLVTDGKVDPQITSQQIQSIGEKIGNIDWKSLPLLR